ncbi:sialin-like [Argopecten irradians]|uniref:sialin-like n=1 Tax=Argopecten irradians TaxID=31199 RepID=UPI003722BF55
MSTLLVTGIDLRKRHISLKSPNPRTSFTSDTVRTQKIGKKAAVDIEDDDTQELSDDDDVDDVKQQRRDDTEHESYSSMESYGTRHTFTILSFLGYFNLYTMRFNISVAIVSMANHTDPKSDLNTTVNDVCPGPNLNKTTSTTYQAAAFDWDESTQGLILSSFSYGYVATQILGGFLATKIGGKHIFGYGVLVTAILSLVTPVVAGVGTWALIALRVIEGLAEGMTFPAIFAMQGKWTPEMERSFLPIISSSGATIGSVVVLPVTGILCDSSFLGGWPSAFYVFGGVSVLWFIFWHFLIYETPSDHPRITAAEEIYIESTASEKKASFIESYSELDRVLLLFYIEIPNSLESDIYIFCNVGDPSPELATGLGQIYHEHVAPAVHEQNTEV